LLIMILSLVDWCRPWATGHAIHLIPLLDLVTNAKKRVNKIVAIDQ
jgi:hypothetical protein